MNSLVFNNVAKDLKTTIYGETDGGTSGVLKVDASGNLRTLLYGSNASNNPAAVKVTNDGNLLVDFASTAIMSTQPVFTAPEATTATLSTTSSTIITDFDMSKVRTASVYIYNTSTSTATYTMYTSPDTAATYLVDKHYGEIALEQNTGTVIVIPTHGHYFALTGIAAAADSTTKVYINAQS